MWNGIETCYPVVTQTAEEFKMKKILEIEKEKEKTEKYIREVVIGEILNSFETTIKHKEEKAKEKEEMEKYIRQEIVGGIVNNVDAIIRDKQVEENLFSFTTFFMKGFMFDAVENNFLHRDEGGLPEMDGGWEEDEEPMPPDVDSWSPGSVPVFRIINVTETEMEKARERENVGDSDTDVFQNDTQENIQDSEEKSKEITRKQKEDADLKTIVPFLAAIAKDMKALEIRCLYDPNAAGTGLNKAHVQHKGEGDNGDILDNQPESTSNAIAAIAKDKSHIIMNPVENDHKEVVSMTTDELEATRTAKDNTQSEVINEEKKPRSLKEWERTFMKYLTRTTVLNDKAKGRFMTDDKTTLIDKEQKDTKQKGKGNILKSLWNRSRNAKTRKQNGPAITNESGLKPTRKTGLGNIVLCCFGFGQ